MVSNDDRAENASVALAAYVGRTRYGMTGNVAITVQAPTDPRAEKVDQDTMNEWLTDLIGDLCHLAQMHGLRPKSVLSGALNSYAYESKNPDEG